MWSLAWSIFLALGCSASPTNYTYEYNSVAVTGGGYVTGLIAHPAEKGLMYARTDIGSSYRWNVTLNKWIPLTDFISEEDNNLFGTESIGLDPSDPSRLYLAQGRYLTSNQSAFFVSDDQGDSFNIYPAPFPMGSNELGRNNGERLAVNPFNGNELYMGTRTEGLWRSTDRAQTWQNVTSFPDAFANTIGISFVLFDTANNGTIYAGATAPQGLFRSTDAGVTWAPLSGQPSSWNGTVVPQNATGPQSTAPQPMKAVLADDVLYVTYGDAPGPYGVSYGAVYACNISTDTWRDITPSANSSNPAPYEPQAFPNGGFCGLSVSANDSNTLVVTSLDRDPGPALDSLYISQDGGATWKDVSQLSTPNATGVGGYWGHPIASAALNNGTAVPWLSFDWSQGWGGYGAPSPMYGLTKFGWWMTALLMSPWDSNTVMYGTGATIWASDDVLSAVAAQSSPQWHVQAQGIEETATLAMISPREGAHLLSGFGDINGMVHTDLDTPQPMYDLPVYSNLNSLDWAGSVPETVVRVGQNQLVNTPETGCHLGAYSTNGGYNWTTFGTCQPLLNSTFTDAGTIAIDAAATCLVWSAGSNPLEGDNGMSNVSGPYYSPDHGATWHSPTGLGVQTPNITSDKVQSGTFYSYTDGTWYSSTDGGKTYASQNGSDLGLPGSVGALPVVDPMRAGHVYLPLGQAGLYFSADFGASWSKTSADGVWPSLFTVGAPAPNATTPALYLWGTTSTNGTTGLFRSDNNGAQWIRINDDQHQYGGAYVIQGDPRVYGRVFVGTFGRGIVRAEISSDGSIGGGVKKGTGGI